MQNQPALPYGSWPSPISIELAVSASRGLSESRPDGADVYVLESRPVESGRVALLRRTSEGRFIDVAPEYNVRTRVHEYGGGAYAVRDGLIVFSEFVHNRLLLKADPESAARVLVSEPSLRFADMEIDRARRVVYAVMEDQSESAIDARNLLVGVSLDDGHLAELATGHDFYSDPTLSPDGDRVAFLTWDFPRMPWDGTDLWVADIGPDGRLAAPRHVAGGETESVLQPRWGPDGSLYYLSDRTDWWNIYRWRGGEQIAVAPMAAEVGEPQWVFGLSAYDVAADGSLVAFAHGPGGGQLLHIIEGAQPRLIEFAENGLDYVRVASGAITGVATSFTRPTAVVRIDLATGREERLREASSLDIGQPYLATPRRITFPTSGGREAYAWYYPPTNPDVSAPDDERPPLVVFIHGGPTSAARTSLSLERQAFTSRGFAVVDVDYGGSSGFGRAYRERLHEAWGVVDVDDCSAAAAWLVAKGLADAERLAIRGGSAGGYTTLACLCFGDTFAAGATMFGLGDLEAFTQITHKFESRYMDYLIGPYPATAERYRERSPDRHAFLISRPVLVMQGADDRIVPPSQAEGIVAALEHNGVAHAYLLFEGEGHGFRQAANQQRALEAELSFYAQVFGFSLADDFAPIEVVGL
jgi:dipeptidyl aminopeptidase/acylaminoacyl peptidase